ncbi:hypothetical protein BDV25DRAFT_139450 [Aspergillus avenaceus]|uniref:Uncharacterized protein n=1 Tax=Aspergillus avenaceus TaxID=36643 RepID=A0A5N6TWU0_ASPAV|nr:hypothetical protein BDV25DRAFT_139450 [Aspergillus avenaceus]
MKVLALSTLIAASLVTAVPVESGGQRVSARDAILPGGIHGLPPRDAILPGGIHVRDVSPGREHGHGDKGWGNDDHGRRDKSGRRDGGPGNSGHGGNSHGNGGHGNGWGIGNNKNNAVPQGLGQNDLPHGMDDNKHGNTGNEGLY